MKIVQFQVIPMTTVDKLTNQPQVGYNVWGIDEEGKVYLYDIAKKKWNAL